MTESEVDRIETSLGVKLPASYRHLLTHFPVYFQGTYYGPVWDHADALIKRNRDLRSTRCSWGEMHEPIPFKYVFIGGYWQQNLLDLETDPPIVVEMEHEDVTTIRPHANDEGKMRTLQEWFNEHLNELKNNGIDPNVAVIEDEEPKRFIVPIILLICFGFFVYLPLMLASGILGLFLPLIRPAKEEDLSPFWERFYNFWIMVASFKIALLIQLRFSYSSVTAVRCPRCGARTETLFYPWGSQLVSLECAQKPNGFHLWCTMPLLLPKPKWWEDHIDPQQLEGPGFCGL